MNGPNFATLDFDWEGGRVHASIRNEYGEILSSSFISISSAYPPLPCVSGTHKPKICGLGSMILFIVVCVIALGVLILAVVAVVSSASSRRRRRVGSDGSVLPFHGDDEKDEDRIGDGSDNGSKKMEDDSAFIGDENSQFRSFLSRDRRKATYRRLCDADDVDENL